MLKQPSMVVQPEHGTAAVQAVALRTQSGLEVTIPTQIPTARLQMRLRTQKGTSGPPVTAFATPATLLVTSRPTTKCTKIRETTQLAQVLLSATRPMHAQTVEQTTTTSTTRKMLETMTILARHTTTPIRRLQLLVALAVPPAAILRAKKPGPLLVPVPHDVLGLCPVPYAGQPVQLPIPMTTRRLPTPVRTLAKVLQVGFGPTTHAFATKVVAAEVPPAVLVAAQACGACAACLVATGVTVVAASGLSRETFLRVGRASCGTLLATGL